MRHAAVVAFAFVVAGVATPLVRQNPPQVDPDTIVGPIPEDTIDQLGRVFRTTGVADMPGTGVEGGGGSCEPKSCAITCTSGSCSASTNQPNMRAVCGCAGSSPACWLATCS